MHRTLRMLGIITRLQQGHSTLRELADRFECSTKSIQRDLDEMLTLGIPVVTTRGRQGGVSIDTSWWLGPMNLTPDEIETIVLAIENAEFLHDREAVLSKIRTAVRPGYFDPVVEDNRRPRIQPRSQGDPVTVLSDLRKVMARDLWCRILYHGGTNSGWRVILPTQLQIAEQRWYVNAVDERSGEFRTFRLDRIGGIEPALGPSNAASIIEQAQSQPDYRSTTYPEVIAELTAAGLRFCNDHPRLRDCLVDGMLRFHCPPSDYAYMARDLMRMGTDCKVIAPAELRLEMQRINLEMLEHLNR